MKHVNCLSALLALSTLAQAQSASATSSVRDENKLAGTTAWRITNPANGEIEGYASLASVSNQNGSIRFYVNTSAPSYTIGFFRLGWYGGLGGRGPISPPGMVTSTGVVQQTCPEQADGMIECNWNSPYTLTITSSWVSGVYLALLTASTGKQSYVMFVVRDDARPSPVLFQSTTSTYQAYNDWGGKSLYVPTAGPAHRVSFNRPYAAYYGTAEFFYFEINALRWLEREGYDVTYTTSVDLDGSLSGITSHKIVLTVGHDEYWSWNTRANLEAARNAGTSVAVLSGNTAFWQIRFGSDSWGNPGRTIVGYKGDAFHGVPDPNHFCDFTGPLHDLDPFSTDSGSDSSCSGNPLTDNDCLVTTLWRCPPINKPEESFLGVQYVVYSGYETSLDLNPINDFVTANTSHWVYAGTGRLAGDRLPGLVGFEVDKVWGNAPPYSVSTLGNTPFPNWDGHAFPVATDSDVPPASVTSNMTLYVDPSGAVVFNSGSNYWSKGLDSFSDGSDARENRYAQQMTRNVLTRAGARADVDVVWTNPVGVLVSGNSLQKSSSSGVWSAGAISTRGLKGDGYVEFTATETTLQRMAGLSNGDLNQDYVEIDFAIYLANGIAEIHENGLFKASVGAYSPGDKFRVSIESGVIKYRRNGTVVYTSAQSPVFPAVVDTSLKDNLATVTNAVLSGDLTDVVTPIAWANRTLVNTTGSGITKTHASPTWNAGAASEEGLRSGDGYAEFTAVETNKQRMFGLSNGEKGPNYTGINYALYLNGVGALEIHESGAFKASVGSFNAGDRLRVGIESGVVKYRRNGNLLFTSAIAPIYPLVVDASILGQGGTITNAVLSGNKIEVLRSIQWTKRTKDATGHAYLGTLGRGGIYKLSTGGNGWNSVARSTQEIAVGAVGFAEMTATENNLNRMFGLNHARPAGDSGYSPIDFAIYLASGSCEVYESGAFKAGLGTYNPQDRFRVAVENVGSNKVVRYYRNGVQLYQSLATPTLPLFVDAAFNFIGATVADSVIWSSAIN